jgi:hypothetical protein
VPSRNRNTIGGEPGQHLSFGSVFPFFRHWEVEGPQLLGQLQRHELQMQTRMEEQRRARRQRETGRSRIRTAAAGRRTSLNRRTGTDSDCLFRRKEGRRFVNLVGADTRAAILWASVHVRKDREQRFLALRRCLHDYAQLRRRVWQHAVALLPILRTPAVRQRRSTDRETEATCIGWLAKIRLVR